MPNAFTTNQLLTAFDAIGQAAVVHGERLEFAVYGGAALMLASNFRYASEDVDIAPLAEWPTWLSEMVAEIAAANDWAPDWLNDAVGVFLSREAGQADHVLFGSFPRQASATGLNVVVPTAEYMLALKLKSLRVLDPTKGEAERGDILALMHVCGISDADGALAILERYFPVSAAAPEKLRFLLKHVLLGSEPPHGTPEYPQSGR